MATQIEKLMYSFCTCAFFPDYAEMFPYRGRKKRVGLHEKAQRLQEEYNPGCGALVVHISLSARLPLCYLRINHCLTLSVSIEETELQAVR